MAKIVIFGAGDIARLAHFYFTTDTNHEVVGFTVDRAKEASLLLQPRPRMRSARAVAARAASA